MSQLGKLRQYEMVNALGSTAISNCMITSIVDAKCKCRFPITDASSTVNMVSGAQYENLFEIDANLFVKTNFNTGVGALQWVNFETGAIQNAAVGPSGIVNLGDILADKSLFVVGTQSAPFIEFWDPATRNKVALQIASGMFTSTVDDVKFSPDGSSFIATSRATPWASLFTTSTRAKVSDLAGTVARISRVDWSPDGNWVVLGGDFRSTAPGSVLIYDTASFTLQSYSGTMFAHSFNLGEIRFSPDSQYIAGISNGPNASETLVLIRMSDLSRIPVTLPTELRGHLETNICSAVLKWLSNTHFAIAYTTPTLGWRFVVYDITSMSVVCNIPLPFSKTANSYHRPQLNPSMVIRKISGTVKDGSGNPLERKVVIYHRETNDRVGEATSDALGVFSCYIFTSELVYGVAIGIGSEIVDILDPITPAVA